MRTSAICLLATIFTFSCSNNDHEQAPLGTYDNGILVLNEGGSGEISYISDDLETVQHDVFNTVNGPGQNLGQFAQSMFFDGDRAFVISNGSNKITVVNRYTMEYIATISGGLNVPKYGAVSNGKAYVTNLATFGSSSDDYLAVIDLSDLTVQNPVALNNFAERIIAVDGKLYVSGGSFGNGNTVTVVNASSNEVETTINTGIAPNSLEERNGIVYVLCANFSDDSKIVKIDTSDDSIVGEITIAGSLDNAQNLDIDGNHVYFTVGSRIYRSELNATLIADSPFIDTDSASPYIGYGFGVHDGRIYISEAAADFASDGNVLIYSTNGSFIDSFPAGLGPNGFYFN